MTVQGVLNVPTTTASAGQYQINNSVFIHNGGVSSDTFVGNASGNFTLSGANNTCIGNSNCGQLTTGTQNTTTGSGNLSQCTTCNFNTSVGFNALVALSTASQNVAVGFNSLSQALTGGNNSALGGTSCSDLTTGANNTCIGINEGAGLTTGSLNTFIGNTTAVGSTQTTTLATFNSTTAVVLGGNDTNLSIVAGMRVSSGGCITGGTTVASVSATQNVVLSQAAICGTSGQIVFFSSPYQTYNTATTGIGCFTTTASSATVNLAGTGTCTVALMGLLKGMRVTANTVTMTNGSTITAINSNTQFTISAVAGAGGAAGNATFQNPLGGNGCMTCANTVLIGRWLAGMFPNNLSGNLTGGIGFADGAANVRADYGITTASVWTFAAPVVSSAFAPSVLPQVASFASVERGGSVIRFILILLCVLAIPGRAANFTPTDYGAVGDCVADDTAALFAMRTAILAAQGLGSEAMTVSLRGLCYKYNNNRWLWGIRNLYLLGGGALLQNVASFATFGGAAAYPLVLNRSAFDSSNVTPIGSFTAITTSQTFLINTANTGATSVTLKTIGDAVNFSVGEWVAVYSYDQEMSGGFPPNARFIDYSKVVSIAGAVINLSAMLAHTHSDSFPEVPGSILGRARIMPLETFSPIPWGVSAYVENVITLDNPNALRPTDNGYTDPVFKAHNYFLAQGYTTININNLIASEFVPSSTQTVNISNSRVAGSEVDKVSNHSTWTDTIVDWTLNSCTGFDTVDFVMPRSRPITAQERGSARIARTSESVTFAL